MQPEGATQQGMRRQAHQGTETLRQRRMHSKHLAATAVPHRWPLATAASKPRPGQDRSNERKPQGAAVLLLPAFESRDSRDSRDSMGSMQGRDLPLTERACTHLHLLAGLHLPAAAAAVPPQQPPLHRSPCCQLRPPAAQLMPRSAAETPCSAVGMPHSTKLECLAAQLVPCSAVSVPRSAVGASQHS